MSDEIKRVIDEYLEEFKKHPVVKKYLLLKRKLNEDLNFQRIKEQKKELQKKLALSLNKPDYEDIKIAYFDAEKAFNDYPLYMNYLVYEEEVRTLLKEVEIYLN